MAAELQCSFQAGKIVYFLIRNRSGSIWSTENLVFEAYATANYLSYPITAVEQGTASAFYTGTFPSSIPPGVYSIVAKHQVGGSYGETDPTVAQGDIQWNGSVTMPLSDVVTSGQLSRYLPVQLARGVQVLNFPFYLVSQADHVTPFTSGVCSGQILRDSGTWVALQSGAFTERGNGFYTVQALTSGDLNCNTASLLFNAAGISGGPGADPRPFTLILQRVSGQQVV